MCHQVPPRPARKQVWAFLPKEGRLSHGGASQNGYSPLTASRTYTPLAMRLSLPPARAQAFDGLEGKRKERRRGQDAITVLPLKAAPGPRASPFASWTSLWRGPPKPRPESRSLGGVRAQPRGMLSCPNLLWIGRPGPERIPLGRGLLVRGPAPFPPPAPSPLNGGAGGATPRASRPA